MGELTLRQVRSANGASAKQRDTLRALKLGRIGRESKLKDTPQLQGMLRKVDHLVAVDGGGRAREGA